MNNMIELSHVYFYVESRPLIQDVSLVIPEGEFAALTGENGAGKSTLLKLMMGLIRPASGSIIINGQDTKAMKVSQLAKSVGYLFQNPDRQLFGATVRQELAFGLDYLGITKSEADQRVNATLDELGLDPHRAPLSLSRGERQRVALASIFVRRPKLLLLDEPTTGLDYRECLQMMNSIARLNKETGATVLMVTHDMEIALDFAPRMLILSEGKLLADGQTHELMRDEPLLARACLMPAQMVALAARLRIEPGQADNADAMAAWLERRKGGAV
ncbi:hypothetical protein AGMMS49992_16040 [Clostridia bacterium]|nr:hypothetical protein AGMMS49992_16040 [Clostridia bacterium]